MAVTMAEIAEKAGVSKATVSRVLNGLAVKPETERRVRSMMSEMRYEPHRMARGLASRATGLVGVLAPEWDHPYAGAVLAGIEREARRRGKLITLGTFGSWEPFVESLRPFAHPPLVEGLLVLVPSPSMKSALGALVSEGFPVVALSERSLEDRVPCVVLDNRDGMKQAAQYLLSKGHRDVGFITGLPERSDSKDRLEGFRDAFREAGFPVRDDLIVAGDYRLPAGMEAAEKLMGLPNPPTAILASNDMMAVGAQRILSSKYPGRSVALIGFDDLPLASLVKPALTTVAYDLAELGAQAASKMFRLASGEEKGLSTVHLKTRLILRESA